MTIVKWRISGQGYKHLTRFSRFALFKAAASTAQKINSVGCSCAERIKVEHLCSIIPKAQGWLVLNLPVFIFVYIHFNVPPTRVTDLVRNVSDEKIY